MSAILREKNNMDNKPIIGIFTTFWNFDSAYSLCSVCRDQLTALVKNGYKTILFVLPSFKDDNLVPEGVEIRKVVPQIILEPYKELQFPSHWKEDTKKIQEMCEMNMLDIDFLICHDIFFIDTYLPYNIGLRDALPKLKCKILAWVHSAPSQRQKLEGNPHANRYNPIPGKLVYLNHDKVVDIAEMFGMWSKDVRVVHNSRDPRTFWDLDPFVKKLIDNYNIFEADIISVIALSTPRMLSGKGVDKIIKIHSKLKELGYKTRLIVCNAHANAEKEKRMLAQTQLWAAERNIDHTELIFTSLQGNEMSNEQEIKQKQECEGCKIEREYPIKHNMTTTVRWDYHTCKNIKYPYELGVSPKIISDLFRISNVFIFPTISEVCSLVLLEAMLSGNLLVLNKKVQSLYEFGGDHAIYVDFEYREPLEVNEKYYLDLAKIISAEFENDKSLQAKRSAIKSFNYDNTFKQLERLFYEEEK